MPGSCHPARRAPGRLITLAVVVVGAPLLLGLAPVRAPMRLVDVSDRLAPFERPNGPDNAGGLAGLAWFDYDNDGRLDLFIPNNRGRPNALFRNVGGGRFADLAVQAGVAGGSGGMGVVAGDIDNDGCADLFVVGVGGIEVPEKDPPRLYANNCDGTFRDISATAGVPGTRTSGMPAFGDVNNDGFIDLFIASAGDFRDQKDPNKLYLNNGDRTFRDISGPAGIEPNLGSVVVSFTDFDKDGWADILTDDGNDGIINPLKGGLTFQPVPGRHRLYRNNGDLTFTDVTLRRGFGDLGTWMGTAWGDYDNDSDLDHFSTSFGQVPLQDLSRLLPGFTLDPYPLFVPHGFWENVGDGAYFRQEAASAGFVGRGLGFSWGASFADFDNDGWEDLFFNGSYPDLGGLLHSGSFMGDYGNPGDLFRNNSRKNFDLVQTFAQQDRFTSGSAVADFDGDGFPDVAVLSTAFGKDPGSQILLRNATANANGWITVRTVGTQSNRDGIGARVRVLAGGLTKLKEVRAGSSFASMDSPWLTFGLGPHAAPTVPVEVTWPSGRIEIFDAQRTRQVVIVREGEGCPVGQPSCGPPPGSPPTSTAPPPTTIGGTAPSGPASTTTTVPKRLCLPLVNLCL